ncbi:apolipoprotein N-acyltransferase [Limnobacter litoralis]|uniref:Apolipoprotein N-acyltransferase n=1 Tax=Limnobacter litoralis TaxID=481366 RepID=A0ABQ5YRF5_9BURK|nr:apolipoprotein N-acyltransferase [Limnobacter litoralis]GLR27213.1 apolipoprotein N-acyltransferase [Limnobacter litoralis]
MIFVFFSGLLAGAPWVASFAPFGLWWLGLLQLVLLGLYVSGPFAAKPLKSFVLGLGFGFGAFVIGVSWLYISLHTYGGLPAALAGLSVAAFSLYLALFGAFACAVTAATAPVWSRYPALLPWWWAALWTFFSWFRATLFTGFSWLNLGDSLVDSPFSGALAWFGNYGLLFFLLGAVFAVWVGIQKKRILVWVPGLAVLAALAGQTLVPLNIQSTAPITVVGVQTNVDQSIKFDPDLISQNMASVFELGDAARRQVPQGGLLIFPETVDPLIWSDTPPEWQTRFHDYASDGRKVVMGAALQEGHDFYNSIVLFDGTESRLDLEAPNVRHDKRHLVPFGEFIPFGFHWFVRMLNMPMGEFASGKGAMVPFDVGGGNRMASSVCYEDTFGGEFANLLANATVEPTVLLNLSNLAWFGQSWALEQHAQMGRARAAEHRKPEVRVTNTGLSGLVDEYGQWIQKVPPGVKATWKAQFVGKKGLTPFARTGPLLWYFIWIGLLVAFALSALRLRAYNRHIVSSTN